MRATVILAIRGKSKGSLHFVDVFFLLLPRKRMRLGSTLTHAHAQTRKHAENKKRLIDDF